MILHRHVHPVATKKCATSADRTDRSTILAVEVELSKRLSQSVETASQHYLDTMNTLGFFVIIRFGFSRFGQEIMTVKDKVRKTCYANDDANLAQLEHAHSFSAGFLNETIHNEVCACTDQGTYSTKNCCIAQGNEELCV